MNPHSKEKLETLLMKVLELLEKGKSPKEILNLFPEHRKTLQKTFTIIDALEEEKKSLQPPRKLLMRIIDSIPLDLKEPELIPLFWKVLIPLGIVASLLLIFATTQFIGKKAPESLSLKMPPETKEQLESIPPIKDRAISEKKPFDERSSTPDKKPTTLPTPPQPPLIASKTPPDPFELASIEAEAKGVGFDSDLENFFAQETSLKEIDPALGDF